MTNQQFVKIAIEKIQLKIISNTLKKQKNLIQFFQLYPQNQQPKNFISLLRSPHVHKKAFEQFWTRNYITSMSFQFSHPWQLKSFFLLFLVAQHHNIVTKQRQNTFLKSIFTSTF